MDPIFEAEEKKLAETIEAYRALTELARERFALIPRQYGQDPDLMNAMMTMLHNQIARLGQGAGKPYFARIDFLRQDSPEAELCYIGKIGVLDEENRTVTVDWRAPISTLYYDSAVGDVSYESPGGVEYGTLELKRQFEIAEGKLLSYLDVDTVSDDELLRPYLAASADNRLKNIVASIQSEQNRIIREKLTRTLIVQGVAGSGKTTVALHRIAYLVYNYRGSISPGQFMVIGPNSFFIRYISSVLPDLDVDSVPQHTFATLVQEYLGEPFTLEGSAAYSDIVDGKRDGALEHYKTSLACRDALERFIQGFEASILPAGGFVLRGCPLLSENTVRRAWEDAGAQRQPGSTVLSRVEKCMLLLSAQITAGIEHAEARVSAYFRERYADAPSSSALDGLHRDRVFIEKELEKGCRASLASFFGKIRVKILTLYRQFVQESAAFLGEEPVAERYRRETLARLRRKTLTQEDLPAVCYLKLRVFGPGAWESFRHAIVDEAQDLGPFDFLVLQRLLCASTFTIVGDLAQSIYHYRGIARWDEAQAVLRGAHMCEMQKCYRTTVEIMEAANHVTALLGLSPAMPVIRHGEPVRLRAVPQADAVRTFRDTLEEYKAQGLVSIALLSKTVQGAQAVCSGLRELGVEPELIVDADGSYSGGICVMPGYLSKGLEFDGVILCDASSHVYDAARRGDMHLLYVAMTRPLHRLDILYSGAPAVALERL